MKKLCLYVIVPLIGLFYIGVTSAKGAFIEKSEQLSLNTENDISKLVIDSGAGFLKVKGKKNARSINVSADLAVYEGNYKLTLEKRGNTAVLHAKENLDDKKWSKKYAKIDLTIDVPSNLEISIDDGSGDIDVVKIEGDLLIDDGSGGIHVDAIGGKLTLDDGSGDVKLSNIQGPLLVKDGSGDLEVSEVKRSVKIDDGSGDIEVSNVAGTVYIDDGSGDIEAVKVDGRVTIDDGSGDIRLDSLKSGVKIIDAGSGNVYQNNVSPS